MKAIITAIGDRDSYAEMRKDLVGLVGEFRHDDAPGAGQYKSGLFISDTPVEINGVNYYTFNFHRVSVKSAGDV